jgi:hypothetical protein
MPSQNCKLFGFLISQRCQKYDEKFKVKDLQTLSILGAAVGNIGSFIKKSNLQITRKSN